MTSPLLRFMSQSKYQVQAQPLSQPLVKPQPPAPKTLLDVIQPFVIGGLSGCLATMFIQPIDMIKVTIQLKSEEIANANKALRAQGKPLESGNISFAHTAREIMAEGGLGAFYRGLSAALLRQVFYTTTRLGIYKTVFAEVSRRNKEKGRKELSFAQKAGCAAFAGFIGSLVGNPADLILVRMQADKRLPLAQRRNYTGTLNAFNTIVREEGVSGLWRGATPTVVRAVVLNLAMLSTYDEAKEQLTKWLGVSESSLSTRIAASAISGISASVASLPLDNAKTKLQKMTKNVDGSLPYKNIFDAMGKTVANEGVLKLWVGLPTFIMRIAPHVIITLISQDFLTDHVNAYKNRRA